MSELSIRAGRFLPPRSGRFWAKAAAFGAVYVVCSFLPRAIKANPNWFSAVWPVWGLVFGVLLVSKRREWFWLLLALLPFDVLYSLVLAPTPVWLWVASRVGSFATCMAGAWITLRWGQAPFRLRSVREWLVLFLAGLGAQIVCAMVFTLCRQAVGGGGSFVHVWSAWFMISLLGFSFITPGIVFWHDRHRQEKRAAVRASVVEIVLVLAALVLVIQVAAVGVVIGVAGVQSAWLLLLVWAALRLGPLGVIAMITLVVGLTEFFPIRTYSFISGNRSIDAGNLVLGLGLIVTSFAGILIALAIEAQRRTKAQLAANNIALQEALATRERQTLELKEANTTLQDVLRRSEALTHDLAAANRALSRSDRAKLELVRAISHELRNPLAGARMMADSLARADLAAPCGRQVANLRSCVEYLQTLLDETLDLTQVESGQIAVKMEPLSPAELCEEVRSMFENMAREKNLRLVVAEGAGPGPQLLGDRLHTKRILINYVSNALKFTAAGAVTLRATAVQATGGIVSVRFEVQDTGPGISPDVQGRVFGKFVRESSGQLASRFGAGLGLALCKQLAELAGGAVGFETKPGKGSTFWATLPFIRQEDGGVREGDPLAGHPDFSELTVAVIDDDPMQIEALALVLGQFGVVPDTMRTVSTALEAFHRKAYDVALVDYHLGEQTGLQWRETVRGQAGPGPDAGTHFHLVTALVEDGLPARAVAAGFRDAHRKPLSLVALFRILRDARAAKCGSAVHVVDAA